MKLLVIGLEASCTKVVTSIFSKNLGSFFNLVGHSSLPNFKRDNFLIPKQDDWDTIVMVTRDYNCALISKNINIQKDIEQAKKEQDKGIEIMKQIACYENSIIFSYESWRLLGDSYVEKIFKKLNIDYKDKIEVKDVNLKYIDSAL